MWLLPFWSTYFNDDLQYFNHQWADNRTGPNNFLCMTPPDQMKCADGTNFEDLPIVQWRMNVSGRRDVGCGCAQGIIGEGSCPQDGPLGFTVSSYISTVPATGAFVGLLTPSVQSMWLVMSVVHEVAQPSECVKQIQWWSLLLFQVSFGLFAIGDDCIFIGLHLPMAFLFAVSLWIYNLMYVCIAYGYGAFKSDVMLIVMIQAAITLGTTSLTTAWMHIFGPIFGVAYVTNHGFFVAECLMLSACFGVGPVLLMFGNLDVTPSYTVQAFTPEAYPLTAP